MDKNCRGMFYLMLLGFVVLGSSAFAMYDTRTGRFLQQDPLGITPNPQQPNLFDIPSQYTDGLNLYQYVQSNPVISVDPFGNSWCSYIPIIGTVIDCYKALRGTPGSNTANYSDCMSSSRDRGDIAAITACETCVARKAIMYIADSAIPALIAGAVEITSGGGICLVSGPIGGVLAIDGAISAACGMKIRADITEAQSKARKMCSRRSSWW